MISRHWRGLAKADKADDYVSHLKTETFPALRKITGFLNAQILRVNETRGVEFLVITNWTSIDAIRAFAGADSEVAVVPPQVQALMVEYGPRARHYEVVE